MGKDLGNVGKAVLAQPKKIAVAPVQAPVAAAPAPVAPLPKPSAPLKPKDPAADAVTPAGKNIFQGLWEGVSKPFQKPVEHEHSHDGEAGHAQSSGVLNNRDSRVFKSGMFSEGQVPAPSEDSIALEDLPEKTDIQEVPAEVGAASGGSGVDLDGDGIVDVRYRQRY